ncbi:MAG: hypothetical protein J5I94_26425 [Phaeodactylibacter sp.]|nr:hypothetical protein [Phaeodactylibacter sp.]
MKNALLPLLAILLLAGCQKEAAAPEAAASGQAAEFRAGKGKIDVCHYSEDDDSWHLIRISVNAWPAHAAHGDVRLDDQDHDGFVPYNECGLGNMGDCDDGEASINPDAEEACDDGIDNNCDGLTDGEDTDACPPPLEIGDNHAGGIIIYLADPPIDLNGDGTPDQGLVAATEDQATEAPWGCSGQLINGADDRAVGAGAQNTADILAECGEGGIAAELAAGYRGGGYSDWFLPSADELNLMMENLAGSFDYRTDYWNSTEIDDNYAYMQNTYLYLFEDYLVGLKSNSKRVRAVRAF